MAFGAKPPQAQERDRVTESPPPTPLNVTASLGVTTPAPPNGGRATSPCDVFYHYFA